MEFRERSLKPIEVWLIRLGAEIREKEGVTIEGEWEGEESI